LRFTNYMYRQKSAEKVDHLILAQILRKTGYITIVVKNESHGSSIACQISSIFSSVLLLCTHDRQTEFR